MACPTCSKTMHNIGDHAARELFLCPQCGTIKKRIYTGGPDEGYEEVIVPKLVERCREFVSDGGLSHDSRQLWNRLGIAESINTPGDRK